MKTKEIEVRYIGYSYLGYESHCINNCIDLETEYDGFIMVIAKN